MKKFIDVLEMWTEPATRHKSDLSIMTDYDVPRDSFVCRLAGGFVRFDHKADIKGRRLFEATVLGPEDAQCPCEEDQLALLVGPFERKKLTAF